MRTSNGIALLLQAQRRGRKLSWAVNADGQL
jgi:hypothetical protein